MSGLPTPADCLPRFAGPVRLDCIRSEALVALHRLEEEEGFDHFTCRPVVTRTEEELLLLYQDALADRSKMICGLYLAESDEPIGKLTVSDYNPRNRSAEIGYYLIPSCRGNGCMLKSLYSLCSLLLVEVGLNKLYAQTGSFNMPSIRLLERIGFRRDAVLRQHHTIDGVLWDDYVYSLLQEELKGSFAQQLS